MSSFEVLTLVLACLSFLMAFYGVFLRRDIARDELHNRISSNEQSIAVIKNQVEFIWNVVVVNGVGRGLRLGLLEKKSPLRWTVDALEKHKDLIDRVLHFYNNGKYKSVLFKLPNDSKDNLTPVKDLPDAELVMALEQQFGDEILVTMREYEYQYETLIFSVLYLCRPESSLFTKFNKDDWPPIPPMSEGC